MTEQLETDLALGFDKYFVLSCFIFFPFFLLPPSSTLRDEKQKREKYRDEETVSTKANS